MIKIGFEKKIKAENRVIPPSNVSRIKSRTEAIEMDNPLPGETSNREQKSETHNRKINNLEQGVHMLGEDQKSSDLIKALETLIKKNSKDDKPKTPAIFKNNAQFVTDFLKSKKWRVCKDNFHFLEEKKGKWIKVRNYRFEMVKWWDVQPDKRNVLRDVALNFLADKKEEVRQEVWEEKREMLLKHVSDGGEELNKAADIILKYDETAYSSLEEYTFAKEHLKVTIRAFLDHVLHKIAGIAHRYPIIPIFWSKKQGLGKSIITEYLVSPMKPFVAMHNLEQLSDIEKNYKIFTQNMIIIVGEMAGAGKSSAEKLKTMAEMQKVFFRTYFTQDQDSEEAFASLIMNGNRPSAHMINDDTDNRRFVDIRISVAIEEYELQQINWLKLIKNEKLEKSFEEKKELRNSIDKYIKTMQQETRKNSAVEQFIEASNIQVNPIKSENTLIDGRKLYNSFLSYFRFIDMTQKKSLGEFMQELSLLTNSPIVRRDHTRYNIFIDESMLIKDPTEPMRTYSYK